MRGIGNYLYWNSNCPCELSWIPPLPPSKLIFLKDRLIFKNFFSSEEILYKNITFIRKLYKPKIYYHFLGSVYGEGFKLSFMPIFSSKFARILESNYLEVNEEIFKLNLSTEKEDRKRFNLPNRPTG